MANRKTRVTGIRGLVIGTGSPRAVRLAPKNKDLETVVSRSAAESLVNDKTTNRMLDLLIDGDEGLMRASNAIASRNPTLIAKFMEFALQHVGRPFNSRSLGKYLAQIVMARPSASSLANFDDSQDNLPAQCNVLPDDMMYIFQAAIRVARNSFPKACLRLIELKSKEDYREIPMTAYFSTLLEEAVMKTLSIPSDVAL